MSWTWAGFWQDDPVFRFNGMDFFQSGRHKAEEKFWHDHIHDSGSWKVKTRSKYATTTTDLNTDDEGVDETGRRSHPAEQNYLKIDEKEKEAAEHHLAREDEKEPTKEEEEIVNEEEERIREFEAKRVELLKLWRKVRKSKFFKETQETANMFTERKENTRKIFTERTETSNMNAAERADLSTFNNLKTIK